MRRCKFCGVELKNGQHYMCGNCSVSRIGISVMITQELLKEVSSLKGRIDGFFLEALNDLVRISEENSAVEVELEVPILMLRGLKDFMAHPSVIVKRNLLEGEEKNEYR